MADVLKLLLEDAPTSMTAGLDDWTLDKMEGRNLLFYKGKNYIPRNIELRKRKENTYLRARDASHLLLAWLVILQSPSRPKPGLSGQAGASTSLLKIINNLNNLT